MTHGQNICKFKVDFWNFLRFQNIFPILIIFWVLKHLISPGVLKVSFLQRFYLRSFWLLSNTKLIFPTVTKKTHLLFLFFRFLLLKHYISTFLKSLSICFENKNQLFADGFISTTRNGFMTWTRPTKMYTLWGTLSLNNIKITS